MTKPIVSIIIPTFNRSDIVERSLRAYLDQRCSEGDIELIVVDDGSTDETPAILARLSSVYPERLRVISQPNRGPAAARNAGIWASQGTLILFAGDDIVPSADLVQTHTRAHTRYSAFPVAVLGHVTWSHEFEITPFMQWLERDGMQFGFSLIRDRENVSPEMFYTSNISVGRDFLMGDELFDEQFTAACWEDIDLGLRLRKRGLRIIYEQDAIGYHVHRTDFNRFVHRTRTAGYFRAMLIEKHNLPQMRHNLTLEVAKLICGSLLRLLGWGRLRRLGYRWSLNWHEYVGMKKFLRKETKDGGVGEKRRAI